MEWTRFSPPDVQITAIPGIQVIDGQVLLSETEMEKRGGGIYGSSLALKEKLWEMHLSGGPIELGMAQSLLGSFLMREQEAFFVDQMDRLIPSRWIQRLLKMYVRWHFRGLEDQVPGHFKEELRAMALTYPDPYLHLEETYQRFLYLHAFHDITQAFEDSPLIACSSFGAWGSYTADGHLILGRNFDFEEGRIFDLRKAVMFFRPSGGIPFVSIAWAGMAGVVTGLNAEGIFISVNAARSREMRNVGIPVVFLIRRVLQEATTIDKAVSILKEAPMMVADIFLLGDGKARKAVVVEKTPYGIEVREGEGFVIATNHFLGGSLKGDRENIRITERTSTIHRYLRLKELLNEEGKKLDPTGALKLLRDRRGLNDTPLAPGNRSAVNSLIATHSVVVDATAGLIWVSESPHLLGFFRCFDLKGFLRSPDQSARRPSKDLQADPFLTSGEYERYILFRDYLGTGKELAKKGLQGAALDYLKRALSIYPDHPEANLLAGRILFRQGRGNGAKNYLSRYLNAFPADPSEAQSIRKLLAEGG
jgi:hypothetical protein